MLFAVLMLNVVEITLAENFKEIKFGLMPLALISLLLTGIGV